MVEKSRIQAKNNVSHSDQSYTFVVDYGQYMEMQAFGGNQPGDSYYFTLLSVYNLGVVNCAHIHSEEAEPKDHMHCHVNHEGIASKGANNVASLILQILTEIGVMRGRRGRWIVHCLQQLFRPKQEQHSFEIGTLLVWELQGC